MKRSLTLLLLNYFRFLAKIQLRKNRPLIIGVTGSAGKTTVMHAIKAVLQDHFTVKISEKANSQSGLSLNILGLKPGSFSFFDWLRLAFLAPFKLITNWEKYTVYVAEMGIDGPDAPANMEYLLSIITPTIGVLTNVNLVHAQAFDHLASQRDVKKREQELLRLIAAEKAKLITHLPASGFAIFTFDQAVVAAVSVPTVATQLTVGTGSNSTVRVKKMSWNTTGKQMGTTCTLRYGKETAECELKDYLLPEHYGVSFACAAAVGLALKLSLSDAAAGISKHFELPPGRATLLPAVNHATILDSSYNSSPTAVMDFLEFFAQLRGQLADRRLVALLGDMREIGKLSGFEHTRIARRAAEVADAIYLVGPQMREHALPVLKKAKKPVFWFASAREAGAQLKLDLKANDILFVKGSQNTIFLETAIEQLLSNPSDAAKLCRRGRFWEKQRKKYFKTT